MALTLIEAAKRGQGTEVQKAVVQIYALSSPILTVMPFRTIPGNALRYNQEKTLPGVAFRGINEGFTASTGILNPVTEALTIAGGDIEIDNFIIKTEGPGSRSVHEAMKIKALAEDWQRAFVKGDTATTPKEFDGLQVRITGNQLLANGATSGGDALSLAKLDEMIDSVLSPTHLIMNKSQARRITQAARTTTVGGYVNYEPDEFGRRIMTYNDLPILKLEDAAGGDTVLPYDESNPGGGGAASTSIYCVSLGDGMLTGIENGGMDVRDLGEGETTPTLKTRIEWYSGITIMHGRAAGRLWGIKDAAAVA